VVEPLEEEPKAMPCPFLEEVVMVYCRAYPVRKLVPRDQTTTASPCMGEEYRVCPFFKEIMIRLESASGEGAKAIERETQREVV
jgi:hypothetical protein